MSSKQDLIEMQEVIKQCLTLIKDLSTGWEGVVKSINKINSNKPSTYIATQKELKQSVDALNDSEVKLTKAMEKKEQVEKKLQATTQQILTSGYNLNKQKEKELATEAKLQAQLEKSQNTYNRVQQKVNETTQAYNNLAAKKALGIDLNDKEQRTLALLEARLNKYQGVLKGVDANIGKYQRNVGNYASGWNGLSNSINQLTREAPAFAVSMSTGFLALSNNLPILFDEIQRVNTEVKTLRAQGKPTEGVLTRLASSFFSLQTAMSLGVTLLTIYGADIVKWIDGLVNATNKTDRFKIAVDALNETMKEGEYKTAFVDVNKVAIAFEQAEKGVISKDKALKIYNKTLGTALGEAKSFNEAQDIFIAKSENYVQATLKMAVFNNLLAKSAELGAKRMELLSETQITTSERFVAIWNRFKSLNSNLEEVWTGGPKRLVETIRESANANNVAIQVMEDRAKKAKELKEEEEAVFNVAKQTFTQYQQMSKGLNIEGLNGSSTSSGGTQSTKDQTKALIDLAKQEQATAEASIKRQIEEAKFANDKDLQYALEQQLAYTTYKFKERISELEIKDAEQLKSRKIELAEEFSSEIIKINQTEGKEVDKKYEEDLKEYQKYLDIRLKAKQDALDKEEQDELKAIQKRMDERQKRYETASQYGMDFSFSSFGFGSLDVLKEIDTFVLAWEEGLMSIEEKTAVVMTAIANVMSDALNQINSIQQANFEAQLSRLEIEKDTALKFAGDSATGKEAIERQYNEKSKEIKRKQVQQEKKIAIFSAIINVAQGITASLAQGGVAGIIMAALIGVLGAVQIASIASQPLPAFWTGTDNAPEGLALTQEKGAEMITDKNGKIKTLGNNKGPQLTYLNKGDKVYNASDTTDKINEMLLSSGISPIVKVENKGLTKEEMIDVMNQTLAKQPKIRPIFDEKGARTYIENENSKTIIKGRNARI